MRDAIGLVACCAYLFVVLAIVLLPETRGRDLSDLDV